MVSSPGFPDQNILPPCSFVGSSYGGTNTVVPTRWIKGSRFSVQTHVQTNNTVTRIVKLMNLPLCSLSSILHAPSLLRHAVSTTISQHHRPAVRAAVVDSSARRPTTEQDRAHLVETNYSSSSSSSSDSCGTSDSTMMWPSSSVNDES